MQFSINPFTHRLDAFEQSTTGAGQVEFLTGNSGGVVGPDAAHNINLIGGGGATVQGNPATNTLTVYAGDGGTTGTGTTVGAATTTIVTLALGAVPGVYLFRVDLVGFDPTTPLGVAYFITACIRTTGAAGVEVTSESGDDFEEGVLIGCDYNITALGNSMILEVTGVAGKTINWKASVTYTFRG